MKPRPGRLEEVNKELWAASCSTEPHASEEYEQMQEHVIERRGVARAGRRLAPPSHSDRALTSRQVRRLRLPSPSRRRDSHRSAHHLRGGRYDSLTSDRPYRKAMSPFEAKEIIVKGAATDFDPQVVDAFVDAFRRGELEVPAVVV